MTVTGPLLVDDETAGELVVDVADIDGDFRRFGFVLVEEVQQLLGAGRDRPRTALPGRRW